MGLVKGHATAIEQKAKKLRPRHLKFIENYLNNGFNATQAYLDAGFRVKNRIVATRNASRLLTNANISELLEDYRQEARGIMKAAAPLAASKLSRVLNDPKEKASTQVMAAREILNRAGVLPPKQAKPEESFNIKVNLVPVNEERIKKIASARRESQQA